MNDYGVMHIWTQGDLATRGIAIVLLFMSILSWAVLLIKAIQLTRLRRMSAMVNLHFWTAHNLKDGCIALGNSAANPYLHLVHAGQDAHSHHRQCVDELQCQLDMDGWLTRSIKSTLDERIAHLQGGLAVLASIGSTAPFVGLFGTVWGIYHALMALGAAQQPGLDQVAGPVGEALIMTAFGLFVAIPAVLGYNALVRGNKAIIQKLVRFSHDLHAYFVTGARVSPAQSKVQSTARKAGIAAVQ